MNEKLASAKKKNKNLSESLAKQQQEIDRYGRLPELVRHIRLSFQKQKKTVLGNKRITSAHINTSILGNDEISRSISDLD